ncbi:MAG: LysM peptidoglycan-binding domain-containing protein [Candidatus Riflebacteria bacterium]|nr:LysM peptidoglycan-binding domain-containing protein [Candidatus Riflebacteria bacterium]
MKKNNILAKAFLDYCRFNIYVIKTDMKESRERQVWNNLRARHYAVLILLAVVTLETSAIAIDKFISRNSETAFEIECSFQNNVFLRDFKMAEANSNVVVEIAKNECAQQEEISLPITSASDSNFDNYIEYSIQPGDSLSNIAVRFGSETGTLMRMNNIDDSHVIRAGQTIKVPMPSKEVQYVVRRGDSLSRIAARFKISLEEIISANDLKSHVLLADQKLVIPVGIAAPANEQAAKSEQVFKFSTGENVQVAAAPADKPNIKIIDKVALSAAIRGNAVQVAKAEVKPEVKEEVKVETKAEVKPEEPKKVEVASADMSPEIRYTIGQGDSLLKLAHKFNTTVAQLQSDNNIEGTLVKIGQEIKISPNKKMYRVVSAKPELAKVSKVNLLNHKIRRGESLSVIAKKYRTTVGSIVAQNNLKSTVVLAGQTIKVPAAKGYKITNKTSVNRTVKWKRPTRGYLSSAYGYRKHPVYKKRSFHAGIDIAAPKGTPILAATNGKVIYAGRRSGYGNLVIVSHANGYSTRYAHCSSIIARKGQQVKAGQIIGRVGATGVATGNHLHFEVRKNGKTLNPISFIK